MLSSGVASSSNEISVSFTATSSNADILLLGTVWTVENPQAQWQLITQLCSAHLKILWHQSILETLLSDEAHGWKW